ncbi:MAG: MFS transporter [Opitutales bacterium]
MQEQRPAPSPLTYARLALMVFTHYFIWSCWYNTLSVYLGALKFNGTQIGLAYGTTAIGALVSPFLVGVVAARFFPAQRILAALHLVGAGLLWWISQQTEFAVFYPALIVYTLTYMAGHGLINTVTLSHAPASAFPVIMTAASAGWIAAGNLVSLTGREDNAGMFTLAATVALGMGVFSMTLPNTPPKGDQGPMSVAKVLGLDALRLFKDRSFAVFMACSFLICIPLSFYFTWTGAFLSELKVANVGSKMTLGQVSEMGFLLLLPLLLPRLGVKKILVLGMAAWAARFGLFAWFNETPTALWAMFGGILLHGMCYDFIFVMGRMYVDKFAGGSLRASAQGLHAVFTLGAGMFVGSWLSGAVGEHFTREGGHDWTGVWLVPAAMAAVLIPVFLLLFREKPSEDAKV